MPSERRLKAGERIYAIGDVHGRLDLLKRLLAQIRIDSACRRGARTKVILLGDLIDRGPQSAQIVARAMKYSRATDRFVVLKGNHEVLMVEALTGDFSAAGAWMKVGGDATLRSWGVPDIVIEGGNLPLVMMAARARIPESVVTWLEALPLYHQAGDFFFVHAGIRPGVGLGQQVERDLLWITDDFLTSEAAHPAVIVHGHSARDDGPDLRPDRIGVDTGAYRTGRLTAVGLEGAERWLISTDPQAVDLELSA